MLSHHYWAIALLCWDSVVPFEKQFLAEDPAGFLEIGCDFATGLEDSIEDRGRHTQSGLCAGAGDRVTHQFHGLEHAP